MQNFLIQLLCAALLFSGLMLLADALIPFLSTAARFGIGGFILTVGGAHAWHFRGLPGEARIA